MAEAALVESDIQMGQELLGILDAASFPVTGAAWVYYADAGEWRLLIRTPRAEKDLLGALREVAGAMDAAGDLRSRIDLARIKLVPPKDKVLAAIGSVVRVDGASTIRFSRNMINGILIDDALIYRLAA
ncbi:hypothetical protein LPW26_19655 [Rhodopseudomonas sp. HC1]|uniref:hypothetical protein n=1 Tax=Rhodopseudomonas infernalis TaxID=2897386 RepID=UPI001EE96410|nr:hypothetical protein [Rhodopseudomonas infernalis]MCG6206866.1 hypothetical protein [Rhodopseudomonas infernalis]